MEVLTVSLCDFGRVFSYVAVLHQIEIDLSPGRQTLDPDVKTLDLQESLSPKWGGYEESV